jgi:Ca2+-binding EF-hand superfamily protein
MIEDSKLPVRSRITLKEMTSIFKLLDVNGDGRVSRQELIEAFLEIKEPII